MIVVITILSCFFIWVKSRGIETGRLVLEDAATLDFHGKVDSIYRDKRDHNEMRVVLKGGYIYGVYADWETKIELGDSLSKKRGTLFVEVYKSNGQKEALDYRILVKSFKK